MSAFKPKYISFDCYGTLINFRMADMARKYFADSVSPEEMVQLIEDFSAYRLDEVLGYWKPYEFVVRNAVFRTCKRWNIEFKPEVPRAIYEEIPGWGPHADVPEPLARVAKEIPLVILSNAMDEQIPYNVKKLGAPFAHVFTAQQAQAYKPQLKPFEYMLDSLGCGPEDMLHVSSSLRYDLMSAADVGIKNTVFVDRGHGPSTDYYGYHVIRDLSGLPGVVGLE